MPLKLQDKVIGLGNPDSSHFNFWCDWRWHGLTVWYGGPQKLYVVPEEDRAIGQPDLIGDVSSLHVQQQLLLPNESRDASVGMTGPPEELPGLNDSIAEGRPEGMPEIGDHTAMDVDPFGGAAAVQSPDTDAGTKEANMEDLPSKIAIVVR